MVVDTSCGVLSVCVRGWSLLPCGATYYANVGVGRSALCGEEWSRRGVCT